MAEEVKWSVKYENDTGPGDDCFWEWWIVTDGNKDFKCDYGKDANWLCDILNRQGA